MSDFEALAARTLAASERVFGSAAVYDPPSGASASCRVVVDRADDIASIGGASFVTAKWRIDVRRAQIAAPAKGGVFVIGAARYVITSAPHVEDPDGLVWSCLCDPE